MRIDLTVGGKRPLPIRAALALATRYIGVDPGPPTVISYRPDWFDAEARAFLLETMRPSHRWDRGHMEMFSAFVSKLNKCNF